LDHSDKSNSPYQRASLQLQIQLGVLCHFLLTLFLWLLRTGVAAEKKTIRKKAKKSCCCEKSEEEIFV
tara:strand:+ start:6283 stop:6486 length:204 start_codon:yes stop_codon:yes gene_type:complete